MPFYIKNSTRFTESTYLVETETEMEEAEVIGEDGEYLGVTDIDINTEYLIPCDKDGKPLEGAKPIQVMKVSEPYETREAAEASPEAMTEFNA